MTTAISGLTREYVVAHLDKLNPLSAIRKAAYDKPWWYERDAKRFTGVTYSKPYGTAHHRTHSGSRSTCRDCWLQRFREVYPDFHPSPLALGYTSYSRSGKLEDWFASGSSTTETPFLFEVTTND